VKLEERVIQASKGNKELKPSVKVNVFQNNKSFNFFKNGFYE